MKMQLIVQKKVYLKLQSCAKKSLVNWPCISKIGYEVLWFLCYLEENWLCAYKLDLLANWQVHPMVHVYQHIEHVTDHTRVCVEWLQTQELDMQEFNLKKCWIDA
jgi:hypothetical protein